ncbi:sorbosone dehydrogenase family protein [Massilia sp. NR 4-1]|uniref:PQQ-dependent sugar dehydrogenase n=1 Tax=Massilia sp. NR 4-1 TaxID=1678028 RepID=UPI00067DCF48|nr:PQQ-dependent sugar dehydrogenase [Massilia sp. NR 4-1]
MRKLFSSAALGLLALGAACGGGSGGGSGPGPGATADAMPPAAAPAPLPAALSLGLREVAAGLSQPILLTAPAGDSRQFIVERPGRIRVLENGSLLVKPLLDISAQTTTDGERGLLSLAFHPEFARNGRFYVYYTDRSGNIAIDRFTMSADPYVADPQSQTRVLSIGHPTYSNHNGGLLAFGPDGFLYIGTGDGGGGGDPNRNAQNPESMLGKLLRLDVDSGLSTAYKVPSDNPYAGQSGKRGEIWALGLRNPWRFAFDGTSRQLYIADVGQGQREEVDIASIATGGNNYGWPIMEGSACYNAASCASAGLVRPAFEYTHGSAGANGCSITGGYVYRGAAIPELAGRYFYSDYCKGFLKSFLYSGGTVSEQRDWGIANVGNVLSFGQDAQGELYVLVGGGKVYKLVRQ